jgi:hypothetical protein
MSYGFTYPPSSGEGKRKIRESTDLTYLAKCAASNLNWMRDAAASAPAQASEVLAGLARHDNSYTRSAVAKNPAVTADILRLLAADDDSWVQYWAARSHNVPADVLMLLARNETSKVREAVAGCAHVPVEALELLATDSVASVRKQVVGNRRVPLTVVAAMAGDSSWEVRDEVLRRGAVLTSEAADALYLAALPGDTTKVTSTYRGLRFSEGMLLRIAREEPNKWSRCNIVDREDLPVSVIEVLAEDPDLEVRARAGSHVLATEEIRTGLARGRSVLVLQALRNREDGERWLVEHPDPKVRVNATKVVPTTTAAFAGLFDDEDMAVREAAVKAAPQHERARGLALDSSARVRLALATLTSHGETLTLLAGDADWKVRRAVAANLWTPGLTLGRLAKDGHEKVSVVAVERVMAILSSGSRLVSA